MLKSCSKRSVLLLVFGSTVAVSFAQQDGPKTLRDAFYTGGVSVERIDGTFDLQDGRSPDAKLNVTLKNKGQRSEVVTVAFRQSANPARVTLAAGETKQVTLSTMGSWSGNDRGPQNLRADLVLLINDRPNGGRIGNTSLSIRLPEASPALIRANMELRFDRQGDRAVYTLNQEGGLLTELNLVYSTGPVTLAMRKTITPGRIDKIGPVKVSLEIKNLGRADARNIQLSDDFDSRDFSAEGRGFTSYVGKENDRRLLWQGKVGALRAGATTTVSYTVNALHPVHSTTLNAAMATIDGAMVGVSNKIRLTDRGRG